VLAEYYLYIIDMGKNKVPPISLRVSQELYDWIKNQSEDTGTNPNAFIKSVLQKAMDADKSYKNASK
jgi:hypothetical protein